jgi:hypothetical protein
MARVSEPTWPVELNQRELWLLVGPLENWIKEMEEPDERVGVLDPDREPELQELRDLLEKLHAALTRGWPTSVTSGFPANRLLTNPLAEADRGRHPDQTRPREVPAHAAHIVTFGYGTAGRKENQLF